LWWLSHGPQPNSHSATHHSPASPAGKRKKIGKKKGMTKLVGQDEDREITYQLPLWAKQTQIWEN